jgi:hypothetical protein
VTISQSSLIMIPWISSRVYSFAALTMSWKKFYHSWRNLWNTVRRIPFCRLVLIESIADLRSRLFDDTLFQNLVKSFREGGPYKLSFPRLTQKTLPAKSTSRACRAKKQRIHRHHIECYSTPYTRILYCNLREIQGYRVSENIGNFTDI